MNGSTLAEAHWQMLGERVARWTGLALRNRGPRELQQALASACTGLGAANADECALQLLACDPGPAQLELLVNHLTVGETYFFRDPPTMDALAGEVLPELMYSRSTAPDGAPGRLRLWSAGCCTGEEPYSLAILLHRLRAVAPAWDAGILATDINTRFLDKARTGVYGEWSFRGDPCKLRDRWFQPVPGGRHAIAESLKGMVRFRQDNLARATPQQQPDPDEEGVDLIVCRHVLMYLAPQALARAVKRFHRALRPGGWLLVSPSEASNALFPGFIPVSAGGVRFYRKLPGDTGPPSVLISHQQREPAPAAALAPPAATKAPDTAAARSPGHVLYPSAPRAAPGTAAAQARILANQGRLDEALACCEHWVAAEPLNAQARYLHAVVLIEQGEQDGAREELVRAVYADPDFVMAHLALGRLALEAARVREARRHFANARQLLSRHAPDGEVPEADGLGAGQLLDMLDNLAQLEALA